MDLELPTRREAEVVALVVEGLTNAAIARRLKVSPRTIQSHLRSVMERLEVHSRTELAIAALSCDLVPRTREDLADRAIRTQALSPRERKLAALVAEGLSDREIARRLVVSLHTVKAQLASARKKVGAKNRVQLAVVILREGVAEPSLSQECKSRAN